jgi:HK97 family phage portal protein
LSLFNVRRENRDALGVHNPFENPTIPLSSIGLDEIFGAVSRTDSGESVTIETAMGIPTLFRCVGLLSTVVAGCTLRTFRNPGKQELFPALLDKGNSDLLYTYFELMELVVAHLALWGNAYVMKLRAKQLPRDDPRYAPKGAYGEDVIVDLRPINPSRVRVALHDGNKIFEVIRVDKDGKIDNSHDPIIYTTFEVMHIPGMGYDGLIGLSVIDYARRTFGTSIAADRLAAKFYANGSQLGGIIKVKAPLASQTQADEIRRRWLVKHSGVASSGDVAVLDAETDYQPITIPPDQLQFLESRGWQTREVARMFGIPPHLVGDVEKSTSWGTGIEQQNVGFVAYTISGWTNRIEQRFTREVIKTRKQYCEFDLDQLMRGAMQERFVAYANAIQWGWMSRNEVRLKENMAPAVGLDEFLTPLNMMTGNPNDVLGPQSAGTSPTQGKSPTPKNDQNSDPAIAH